MKVLAKNHSGVIVHYNTTTATEQRNPPKVLNKTLIYFGHGQGERNEYPSKTVQQ